MNSTHIEFSIDDSTLNMSEKIILGSLLLLISVPGNAFLMALIQFDRIGGDPLKRRITDQVSLENKSFWTQSSQLKPKSFLIKALHLIQHSWYNGKHDIRKHSFVGFNFRKRTSNICYLS